MHIKEKIILASRSPRRAKILRELGFKFIVCPADIKEERVLKKGPAYLVKLNALKKAKVVAKKFKEGIVIGMDTIVYVKKKIIGKPKNYREAKKFLRIFSTYPHWVYTGIAVVDIKRKRYYLDYEKTKLLFRRLSKREIDRYVSQYVSLDRAGGIDIEKEGKELVKEIRGDYYNVVGFPIKKLIFLIRKIKKKN